MTAGRFIGNDLAAYRARTEGHATMPGVTQPSFRCRACGHVKATTGRRQVVEGTSRYGWRCRECVEAA